MADSRGQGATEYLVILGAVLLVSIVVVSATSSVSSSQSSMRAQQSQAYWASLSPFKVVSAKLLDNNLVLGLQNSGSSPLRIGRIMVGGTALPIYRYYSGDYFGSSYCTRTFDQPSGNLSCSVILAAGELAYVAVQDAFDCAGKPTFELSDISFSYAVANSGIQNMVFKADKPLVGSCTNRTCDSYWVKVPGNQSLLVADFCVMKYEAKCASNATGDGCNEVSEAAVSLPSNFPWTLTVNQSEAMDACARIGAGYRLISNREWVAIAANIAALPINDLNSTLSGPQFATGHTNATPYALLNASEAAEPSLVGCNLQASLDDPSNSGCGIRGTGSGGYDDAAKGFYGTSDNWSWTYASGYAGRSQLRTHVLSNGQVIWDFAGNVWEHLADTMFENKTNALPAQNYHDDNGIDGGQIPYRPGTTNLGWFEYTSITNFNAMNYSNVTGLWTSANGIGQIQLAPGMAFDESSNAYNSTIRELCRSGSFTKGSRSGIFALDTFYYGSINRDDQGFRCVR